MYRCTEYIQFFSKWQQKLIKVNNTFRIDTRHTQERENAALLTSDFEKSPANNVNTLKVIKQKCRQIARRYQFQVPYQHVRSHKNENE